MRKILLASGLSLGLALAGLAVVGPVGRVMAQAETTVLGDLLSRALSTPTSRVAIGAVDGALSSDATIRDVVVSDANGPWLRLDRARLVWRRAALLSRRLEVDRLEIGRLEILRRPAPAEGAPAADGPLLPELPLKVEVKAFALAELTLGEPLLGTAARLRASGAARLGPPAEGLDLTLDARRLDAGGEAVVRLQFVPQGERLELSLRHDEPAGGIAARLANLPGLPPVRLDLAGRGTLDDWSARLDLAAGPDLGAQGSARLARAGAERRLTLDLGARIEPLLPAPAVPIFAGTTRLQGTTRFLDGGAIALDALSLTSRLARLDARGTLDANRVVDLTAEACALPSEGSGPTRALDAELDRLAFTGTAKGPLAAPRIEGNLEAAGLRLAQGRLGRLTARVEAEPAGADALRVSADAEASGIALVDPGLARAVGERATLTLRGVSRDAGVDVETFRLAAPALDLRFAGLAGASRLDGTLDAALSDLKRLAALSGQPGLSGAARLSARLSGNPADAVSAALDGSATELSLGRPVLDGLTGGRLALKGGVDWLARAGGLAARDLRLEGATVTATANGRAAADAADLGLTLALPDLRRLDARLAGRATAEARLTGSLVRPNLAATLRSPDARALGRPVRDLVVALRADDVADRLDAAVTLSGTVGSARAAGEVRLRRPSADAYALDRLDFTVGSARITGGASLGADGLGEGRIAIAAPDLDVLSPLVLTPLKGSLDGILTLARAGGRQEARLVARGRDLEAGPGLRLGAFDADAGVVDPTGRPILDGRIEAERVAVGPEPIDAVRLTARGTPAASDIDLTATGARGFAVEARARLTPGAATRLDVSALSARRGAQRFALAGPAGLDWRDGAATLRGWAITASGGGRATLDGTVGGDTLDLALALQAVPLALAEIAQPGIGLAGTLSGEAALRGRPSRPEGTFRLALAGAATPATRSAGLPPVTADASGTLSGDTASVRATAGLGSGTRLEANGTVPLQPDGAIALRVTGASDLALANAALGATGQRLTGRANLDMRVGGTLRAPQVGGAATLAGGTFTDALQGIRLTGLEGRVTGRGDSLVIERLSASTRNGGSLAVRGRVALDPQAGFPGEIRLTAERAELVSSDLATAVASLDLALQGPLAQRPRIAGRIDLVSLDLAIPDRLPGTIRPIATRHVDPPPAVRARLARQQRAERQAAGRRRGRDPFEAALDVTVSAPNRIFVRGRGVDAELGGELRLTGTSNDPVAIGAFDLQRGRLNLLGQRIDLTRGRLAFAGDLSPTLDFLAETRAAEVTARIAVSGPAAQPTFEISSDPDLPQDEVLSRLLFARASGNLSAFQALQLAQAVAQLSGGGGSDAFDRTRRALGVDSLDITAGASGGPAVGASRYINNRLSVGVRAGARPEDTAATATFDVTRRVKIQGEVGADGRSSVGVGAEWEY